MRSWWVLVVGWIVVGWFVGWFVVGLLACISRVYLGGHVLLGVPKDVGVPYVPYVPHLFLFEMCSPTTSRFCHQRHTPSTKMVVDVLGGVCGFFIDARFHQCWVRLVAVVVSRAVGVHCLVAIAVLSWR